MVERSIAKRGKCLGFILEVRHQAHSIPYIDDHDLHERTVLVEHVSVPQSYEWLMVNIGRVNYQVVPFGTLFAAVL